MRILWNRLFAGFQVVCQSLSLSFPAISGRLLNTRCIFALITVISNCSYSFLEILQIAWLLSLRHVQYLLRPFTLIAHCCCIFSDTVILLLDSQRRQSISKIQLLQLAVRHLLGLVVQIHVTIIAFSIFCGIINSYIVPCRQRRVVVFFPKRSRRSLVMLIIGRRPFSCTEDLVVIANLRRHNNRFGHSRSRTSQVCAFHSFRGFT